MSSTRRWSHILTSAVLVYGLWLILSGHYTPFLLAVGLAATAFSVYMATRMELVDHEAVPDIHLTMRIWTYLPWLVWEIFLTNVAAVKIILSPSLPISPMMIRFRGRQKTDLGRVIFANSVTLTPGTITVAVVGEELIVHALDRASVGDMEESDMNRKVANLERAMRIE